MKFKTTEVKGATSPSYEKLPKLPFSTINVKTGEICIYDHFTPAGHIAYAYFDKIFYLAVCSKYDLLEELNEGHEILIEIKSIEIGYKRIEW